MGCVLLRARNSLLFQLAHLRAQILDVGVLPLACAQRVVLEQQLLEIVRCIEVRLVGLVKRENGLNIIMSEGEEGHEKQAQKEQGRPPSASSPSTKTMNMSLTSGIHGLCSCFVSSASQSRPLSHGCLRTSSRVR